MTAAESPTRAGLVSVVTIFLNAETFLEQAVDSVLAQTYDHWELLLVDDGSTDGSTALAQAYADRHPERVRYLEHAGHRNQGMSASRNLGVRHARGEFIALLDADDVFLPRKLEHQVAALERNPDAAMVFGPTVLWYGWTADPADEARDFVTRLAATPGRATAGARVLARILRHRGSPVYTCSMLARRDAVLAVGGFEDRFRGLFEDQAFFAKFLLAHRVYVMREHLDRYRQHPDSCCGGAETGPDTSPALRTARLDYLDWLATYLEAQAAPASLRRAVAYERWLQRHPRLARLRSAARSTSAIVYDRSLRFAFAAGRRIIPRAIRQRLWHAVASTRNPAHDAAPRPSDPT